MEIERWQYLTSKMRDETLTIPEIEELDAALESLRLKALKKSDAGEILITSFGQGMLRGMKIKLTQSRWRGKKLW